MVAEASELGGWEASMADRARGMSFSAKLVSTLRGGGGGAYVTLPDNASDFFGTRARVAVRATFNGVPYRDQPCRWATPVAPGAPRVIRQQLHLPLGGTVAAMVTLDLDLRSVDLLDGSLEECAGRGRARRRVPGDAVHTRREYAHWIADAANRRPGATAPSRPWR